VRKSVREEVQWGIKNNWDGENAVPKLHQNTLYEKPQQNTRTRRISELEKGNPEGGHNL